MNRRWIMLIAVVFIIVALLLPACAKPEPTPTPAPKPAPTPTPAPPPEPKTLKLSYTMPKGASVAQGFEWWGPEFEKRTNGRYKVELYPSSTLVPIPAALDAVKKGVAEIVMTSTGTFQKDFPLSLVMSLPTLGFPLGPDIKDYEPAWEACWELINTVPEVQAEFKDYKLLWPFELNPYYLLSKKKEVHKASDFKGMKVGGSGQKMLLVTENGGASIHSIPPQTYMNLQKGVMEASFNAPSQIMHYKLDELIDYYYFQDFGCGTIVLLMNKEVWNALSPQDQKIVEESWREASQVSAKGMQVDAIGGEEQVKKAGKKITYPTPEETAAWEKSSGEIVFSRWAKDAQDLGISAQATDKVLNAWKDLRKKYFPNL